MEELAKASANPDEINIASDDEEEVAGGVEGVCHLAVTCMIVSSPCRSSAGATDYSSCCVWQHTRGETERGVGSQGTSGCQKETMTNPIV